MDRGDLSTAVWCGTGGEHKVTVRVDDTLVLEAPPTGGVVGYGAAGRAHQQHMPLVVCIGVHRLVICWDTN